MAFLRLTPCHALSSSPPPSLSFPTASYHLDFLSVQPGHRQENLQRCEAPAWPRSECLPEAEGRVLEERRVVELLERQAILYVFEGRQFLSISSHWVSSQQPFVAPVTQSDLPVVVIQARSPRRVEKETT